MNSAVSSYQLFSRRKRRIQVAVEHCVLDASEGALSCKLKNTLSLRKMIIHLQHGHEHFGFSLSRSVKLDHPLGPLHFQVAARNMFEINGTGRVECLYCSLDSDPTSGQSILRYALDAAAPLPFLIPRGAQRDDDCQQRRQSCDGFPVEKIGESGPPVPPRPQPLPNFHAARPPVARPPYLTGFAA